MLEEKNEKEEIADDEIQMLQKFDAFFDGIGSGWTLLVCREAPKEYKSFLEEVPIENPSSIRETIDLGYLARKWGGEVLKLILRSPTGEFKKRILIEMRSYPPLRNGKPMSSEETNERLSPMEIFKMVQEMTPAPKNQTSELMPILQVLLEKTLNPRTPTPAPALNGADQMLEMLTALSKMREFVQPAPEGSQWENVAQEAIKAIMPLIAEKMNAAPPQPQRPGAPVVHGAPMQSNPIRSTAPPIVLSAESDETNPVYRPDVQANPLPGNQVPPDFDLMAIAQAQLAQMSGEDITQLYLAALNDLTDDKREAALNRLDQELFDDESESETPENVPPSISGEQPHPS